ncbi:MAG: flagellar biosynthetic protein FliO [Gammaproteobacteria bacterium]|nr:flagellar biosynthetic protein FliO [Gammaproteobacteria bacterium]
MSDSSFPLTLLFTLLALVVVLIVAWFCIRLLAQLNRRSMGKGKVQIVQTIPIGTRERLMLVHYQGQEYLLGSSTGGITVIERSAIPEISDTDKRDIS